MKFRFSNNPHKQYLWWLLKTDSKLSNKQLIGLDAGCADMGNRIFFKTAKYIALDPDNTLLLKGKEKNPDAEIINKKILDAPKNLKADFVQCIQVLVNADFDTSETLETIEKLVKLTNRNGVLLFNTGRKTQKYVSEMTDLLDQNFRSVEKIEYGAKAINSKASFIGALVKSLIMLISKRYRVFGGSEKTYFRCIGKI